VQLNDIPPYMEPRMCAEPTCLATATKTVCAEPTRCDDVLCSELVACDAHADWLAAMVEQLISGQGKFTLTPESEAYGKRD
jgi:hypothetical protein